MTARFLLNLALALGVTGIVGCSGGTTATDKGDDDDDDDDTVSDSYYYHSGDPTGDTFRGDEIVAMYMLGYVEVAGGSPGYAIIGAIAFTEAWDGDPYNTDESCYIQAEAAESTSGVLDAAATIPPGIEVQTGAYVYENCSVYFGVDP